MADFGKKMLNKFTYFGEHYEAFAYLLQTDDRQMQVFKMTVAANSNRNTLHTESHNMTAATMFDQFDLDVFS